VVLWDTGVTEALDAPLDYPRPGQHVRWAYRSRLWRVLHDRPQKVDPGQRLRSILNLGPHEMDETYELTAISEGWHLALAVSMCVQVPLVGGLLAKLWAGPRTKRGFEASLQALKRWCEDQQRMGGG
jgi:hypothetical protein